jgi:putative ABC transport system permease protein
MLRAAIKSLLAHKLRLALSGVAVVLGVAFVAGSMIFTDTLGKTFRELFDQVSADVTVSPRTEFETDGGTVPTGNGTIDAIPASLLPEIKAVDGVDYAEGGVTAEGVQILGADGKVLGTQGAPAFGVDWSDTEGISPLSMQQGRAPEAPREVAIDSTAAEKGKLGVGDTVRILLPNGPPLEADLVGVFKFGESGNLAGATMAAFDRTVAQELFLKPGYYSAISVRAADGVSDETLRDRVAQAIPAADYEVKTQAQVSEEAASDVEEGLSFINIFLLVFAGIALFVGSFIIFNTFSMLVAQRTRELALLRAVGASRRQVTRSVLLEALAVGLVGSTVGLGLGFALAIGLRALFSVVGFDMPTASLTLQLDTVVWCYVVGIVVTVVAAYFPARRAAKIPPVAALRDDVGMRPASLTRRGVIGGVITAAGAAMLVVSSATEGSGSLQLLGAAVFALLVGVAVLAPTLSRPVVAGLAASYSRLFGTVGKLSRENAVRNPRRTAATASALMIGLALISGMSVLAASTNASVDRLVDRSLGADFVVSNSFGMPFSGSVVDEVSDVPGVAHAGSERYTPAKINGKEAFVASIDPALLGNAIAVTYVTGGNGNTGSSRLGAGEVLVDEPTAQASGWQVGDRIPMRFPGGDTTVTVAGIVEQSPFLGPYVVANETAAQAGADIRDNYVLIRTEPGADPAQVRSGLEAVVATYPNVALQDQTDIKEDQRASVNQILSVIYGLLGLAVLIAALGIINTLALSVIERTREIGLLRAVGMSRRQLRRMVRLESVVIAVFGALLGVALGLVFGTALQRKVADEGVEVLSIPVGQIAIFVLLAGLIGILAAVWPARRAAKLDILQAVTTE